MRRDQFGRCKRARYILITMSACMVALATAPPSEAQGLQLTPFVGLRYGPSFTELETGNGVTLDASAGNIDITAAGGGSDVNVTAPDSVILDAAGVRTPNGTFRLATGTEVNEIVDSGTGIDFATPSDNALVTVSYRSALFWTYMCEQMGAVNTEPEFT